MQILINNLQFNYISSGMKSYINNIESNKRTSNSVVNKESRLNSEVKNKVCFYENNEFLLLLVKI